MLANNALKIIFSHPAAAAGLGGLIGGSGALVYNAFSRPTLDEYGNPIESNDINPFVAAGIGSGVGLVSGMGARMMTPQWSNRFSSGYSQAGRQAPQEVQGYDDFRNAAISIRGNKQVRNQNPQIPEELMPVFEPRSQEELEASLEWIERNREAYQQYQSQKPNPTAMLNPQLPSGFQEQPKNLVYEYFDESPFVRTIVQDVYSPDEQYLYSIAGGKQFQNPDRLPKLIQTSPPKFQEELLDPVIGRRLDNNAGHLRTTYYSDDFGDADTRAEDYRKWMQNNQSAGINPTSWNAVSADSEAARYQKWLESEAIIRNPQKKIV